jgi:hypothetical protein
VCFLLHSCLIKVVNVPDLVFVPLKCCTKLLELFSHALWIECLYSFGVQARGATELQHVLVALLKCFHPVNKRLFTCHSVHLVSDRLVTPGMTLICMAEHPLYHNLLSMCCQDHLLFIGCLRSTMNSKVMILKS